MARRKKEVEILKNVKIESVAAEGKALAKVDSIVVFVPFAVPGDVVDIRIVKSSRSFKEGVVLRLVEPSPLRQEPFCGHFEVCGGCKWQCLPYSEQLKAKQQQVEDQLVRIGHLTIPPLSPIVPSDNIEYYRNKLEFSFSSKKWLTDPYEAEDLPVKDRCGLGFHVGRFFDKVLDIQHCHLQPSPSNEIRNFVRSWALEHEIPFFDIKNHVGVLRTMIVRNNLAGDVMLIISFYEDVPEIRAALFDALIAKFPQIKSLWWVHNPKGNDSISDLPCNLYYGEDAIYETMEDLHFKIGPKSFYQTNTPQAYKLYSLVREFAALTGRENVYDLYTGTGTIALFLARQASWVTGIEYVPEAIEDAKDNALRNGITNSSFYAGDMKDMLTEDFIADHGHPDVMVLDPPRAGIHPDVAKVILASGADRLVYVSCNPASQARDLAILCQKYTIQAVRPVDMFPHTHHVENAALLTRNLD